MKIYLFKPDLVYVYLVEKERVQQPYFGEPGSILPRWQKMALEPLIERGMSDYVLTDFAPVDSKTALSARAAEVLEPIFGPHAEFLPVTVEGSDYFMLRVTTRLHGVVEGAEDGSPLPRDYRVAPTYQFRRDLVETLPPIFEIHEDSSRTFVTEQVIEAIEKADLSGLLRILVWSDARGGQQIDEYPVFYDDLKAKRKEDKAKRAALREKLGLPPWKPRPRQPKATPPG